MGATAFTGAIERDDDAPDIEGSKKAMAHISTSFFGGLIDTITGGDHEAGN
jgi:hypothetical protein